MQVVHAFVKTMEVPVERLKFAPDPLRVNEEPNPNGLVVRHLECLQAHLASIKAQAAGLGIELSGETLLDKQPAMPIAVTPPWPTAHAVCDGPVSPAGVPGSPINLITAFDVHGSKDVPQRPTNLPEPPSSWPADYRAEPDNPFDLPPLLVQFVIGFSIAFGWAVNLFVKLVLRRPRLRIVSE